MNFKSKALVLILLLVLIFTIGNVSASSDIDSNDTSLGLADSISADSDDGVIRSSSNESTLSAPGDGSFTDLQNDINDAIANGGVFNMQRNYYYDNNSDSDRNLRYGVVIDMPLIINGNGKTICGCDHFNLNSNNELIDSDGARIFIVQADNVAIYNVNFVNGTRLYNVATALTENAGIYWSGDNGIVDGCNFTRMFQPYRLSNGNILTDQGGICIYHANNAEVDNFTVNNCRFYNPDRNTFARTIYINNVRNVTMTNVWITRFSHYFAIANGEYVNFTYVKTASWVALNGENYPKTTISIVASKYLYMKNCELRTRATNYQGAGAQSYNVGDVYMVNNVLGAGNRGGNPFSMTINGNAYIAYNNISSWCYRYGGNNNNFNGVNRNNDNTITFINNRILSCVMSDSNEIQPYNNRGATVFQNWNNVILHDLYYNDIQRGVAVYSVNNNNFELYDSEFRAITSGLLFIQNTVNATIHNITMPSSDLKSTSETLGCCFFAFYNSNVNLYDCSFTARYGLVADLSLSALAAYITGSNVVINHNVFNGFTPVRQIMYIESFYQITADSNVVFTNNTVNNWYANSQTGGGFFKNYGTLLVEGNNFNNVRTSDSVGLLYNTINGNAIIHNNNFTTIYASKDYGGIYNEGTLTVDFNNFTSVYASSGDNGVIYTTGSNVNITNNTLINCYAGGDVGGFNVLGDNVTVAYNTFDNFHANNHAIMVFGATDSVAYNNTYKNSYANNRGIVALTGSVVLVNETFINSRITDTNTGIAGVFYITGSDCNLTNITIINCSAATDGGAIYNIGDNNNIINISITNTTAVNGYGGTIYNVGSNFNINNMTIYNTTSTFNGGAIYSMSNLFTLNNTSIIISHSDNDGGAVYIVGDDCIISFTNITDSSAGHYGGAIYCSSNNANLTHININGSYAVMAGAIYIASNNVNLDNVNIDDSTADGNGGAILWAGDSGKVYYSTFNNIRALSDGGAIFFTGSNYNLTKSVFTNINASGAGGALYGSGSGNTVMSDLDFDVINSGNNGGAIYWSGENCLLNNLSFGTITCGANGGAIYWSGEKSKINKIRFEDIGCSGSGGAVYSTAADCNFTDCTFINCSASVNGGGFFLTGGNNTIMVNSSFVNCTSGSNGGAVFWKASFGNLYLSNFTENYAVGEGGAIYWNSDYSNLHDLNITDCSCDFNGGAILVSASHVNMYNLYCDGNAATDGSGGAIYSSASFSELYNSKFVDNNASISGGAVYWSNINAVLHNLTCINNGAVDGGAIYLAESYANAYNLTLIDNNAETGGGALYMAGYTGGVAYDLNFVNNTAGSAGGSIYWSGNDGKLYDSVFDGSGAVDGGAVYWAGGSGNLSALDFTSTNASRYGGVLLVSGANVNVAEINFVNSSASYGGAVYWLGHYGRMTDCNFTGNIADNGGALYLLGSYFLLSDSKFFNNTADNQGGAVYWGSSGNITNCEFRGNRAHSGSAIYNGGQVDIYNTVILDNCADISLITIDWAEDSALNQFNTTFVVYGYDNFLNGIWTISNNIGVNHVTYWNGTGEDITQDSLINPVPGITPGVLYYDTRLGYTNITARIRDSRGNEYSKNITTDLYGVADYHIIKLDNTQYNITAIHETDNYYAYFSNFTIGYSGAFTPSIRLDLSSYEFDYHSQVFVTVRITANKPGHDSLYVDGSVAVYADNNYLFNLTFTDGMVSLPQILELDAGKHNMTVYYAGNITSDGIIISSGYSNTVDFIIDKIALPLDVSVNSSRIFVGDLVNIGLILLIFTKVI